MADMIKTTLESTKIEDINVGSAVKSLQKALEVGLYFRYPRHEIGARNLLSKLGVKSADPDSSIFGGAPLKIESLEAIMNQVNLDCENIKLWKP